MRILIFSFIIAIIPYTNGFWVLHHRPLISQRLDPIISGSTPSAHVHTFVGSAAILGDQQNRTCTTAAVKDDRSRYWAPQLYFYSSTTQLFNSVDLSYVSTYYHNRTANIKEESVKPFPFGFRMIAGNSTSFDSPLNDSIAANAIIFTCIDQNGIRTLTSTLPTGPCINGLRTSILFPSCWDGINLDSLDHKSHVVYPTSGPDTGRCPITHPVRLMTLRYDYIWKSKSLSSTDTGAFVLANGDTIGWSFHADFISGWNVDTLQQAIGSCTTNFATNRFGAVQGCPPFIPSLALKSNCQAMPSIIENVSGSMRNLPGCNAIKNGKFIGAGSC